MSKHLGNLLIGATITSSVVGAFYLLFYFSWARYGLAILIGIGMMWTLGDMVRDIRGGNE